MNMHMKSRDTDFSFKKSIDFFLGAQNQILEKVDKPLCERPKRPDHCPKEIYNILLSHCWAHEPHERARFSMLKKMVDEVSL